ELEQARERERDQLGSQIVDRPRTPSPLAQACDRRALVDGRSSLEQLRGGLDPRVVDRLVGERRRELAQQREAVEDQRALAKSIATSSSSIAGQPGGHRRTIEVMGSHATIQEPGGAGVIVDEAVEEVRMTRGRALEADLQGRASVTFDPNIDGITDPT